MCRCNDLSNLKIVRPSQLQCLIDFFSTYDDTYYVIPVERPYYSGKNAHGVVLEWYADQWFKCKDCGRIWELCYPDFPSYGHLALISQSN